MVLLNLREEQIKLILVRTYFFPFRTIVLIVGEYKNSDLKLTESTLN